ncbi:MAG: hypothetical protein LBU38_03360 [Propionibacteriaceae bacterium]|jgi:hypothetical protein|nr:hypothetical protein [Propionibacteriaceae bacterium]
MPEPVRYRALEAKLRTREGFGRYVKLPHWTTHPILVLLAIAALLLAYNIISVQRTIIASPIPADLAVPAFFVLLFDTHGADAADSLLLTAYVWEPIIIAPIVLILLVIRAFTRTADVDKVYQSYLRSGFISQRLFVITPLAKRQGVITAYQNENGDAGRRALAWMEKTFADPAGDAAKMLATTLVHKIPLGQIIPAQLVLAEFPAGLYLGRMTARIGAKAKPGQGFAVIADAPKARAAAYAIKDKAWIS